MPHQGLHVGEGDGADSSTGTATTPLTPTVPHFVPGGYPILADEVWKAAVRPRYSGHLVVGRDLMEL